jgi:antitoxin VapB
MSDFPGTRPDDDARRVWEREVRLARLRAVAAEIRADMPDDASSDHGWLYDDETGLPK